MELFSTRFKELRKEKGLTQQELASIINEKYGFTFGKSSISGYENGKAVPETIALTKFAEFFNVSVDYLLGQSNRRKPQVEVYKQSFQGISTKDLTEDEIRLIENMIEQFKKNRGVK